MRHVWLNHDGDDCANLDDKTHEWLAAHFEMKDLGVRDGVHYWQAIAEVNYDPEGEESWRILQDD